MLSCSCPARALLAAQSFPPPAASRLLQATPTKQNTLWFQEWDAAGGMQAAEGASATVHTTVEAAVQAAQAGGLDRHGELPVLFIGAVPALEGPVEELPQEHESSCPFFSPGYPFEHSENMKSRAELARLAAAHGSSPTGSASADSTE